MSLVEVFTRTFQFHRQRTLELLEQIEQASDPLEVLGWRPGPGRAHIAWQLMHIGITEEIFATQRLAPHKQPRWQHLWDRFRGGSTPDDDIPSAHLIRQVLHQARESLLQTLSQFGDDRLEEVPPGLQDRGWTLRDVLDVLAWHEAHHQGQAHLTWNLYRTSRS